MDIQRPDISKKKLRKRILIGVGLVALIGVTTVALSRLRPAAPSVDRGQLWFGKVARGPMLRQVRGLGTLVPEEIRWIPATTQGRVEQIILRPGAQVTPTSVILELSNPELAQLFQDAEFSLRASEADLANLRAQLNTELLNQRAQAASIHSDFQQAKLQSEVDTQLAKEGLTSAVTAKLSKVRAEQLEIRDEIEQQRLEVNTASAKARVASQEARVSQARAQHELRRSQVEALKVKAGVSGVLQLVPVEVGQQVNLGTNLARVANPQRLKAEIRIAETQAKDVTIGLKAEIDTRNGVVTGHVIRIDPSVQQGTVLVDVGLEGALPAGARPDLSVDGTIEIERLTDVLYVGRPVNGQANSTIGLFKVIPGTGEAVRIQVKLGRTSVNTIEIIEGLQIGDEVVLSDMSQWDNVDRVRLN